MLLDYSTAVTRQRVVVDANNCNRFKTYFPLRSCSADKILAGVEASTPPCIYRYTCMYACIHTRLCNDNWVRVETGRRKVRFDGEGGKVQLLTTHKSLNGLDENNNCTD